MFITILAFGLDQSTAATAADARNLKNSYDLEGDVLYDPDLQWTDWSLIDLWEVCKRTPGYNAFPYFFYVHTSNMRVWDAFSGFPDAALYDDWLELELEKLDFCKEQPLAIRRKAN